jgi:hypothetical protein
MRVRQRPERHPRLGIAGQGNGQILRQLNAAFAVVGDDLHRVRRSDAHPGLLPRRARPAIGPAFLARTSTWTRLDADLTRRRWLWPVRPADPAQHQPVRSAVPTLVLAGEYDTAVPPMIVRQLPPTLPRSYYYEVPAAPHIQLATLNPVSACAHDHRPVPPGTGSWHDARCVRELPAFDFTPDAALGARHALQHHARDDAPDRYRVLR